MQPSSSPSAPDPIPLEAVDGVYQPRAATDNPAGSHGPYGQASGGPARAPRSANTRFMLAHPARWIALGFGSGLSPMAPGTVGTLWAWWSFHWLVHWLNPWDMGVFLAICLPVGVWACKLTADHLGQSDPGSIVWDEIVAFWLILWLVTPASGWDQFVAFLMFRFFDAAKPGPVRWADRVFKGSGWRGAWGIMFDDLVAAFCVLVLIALWRF